MLHIRVILYLVFSLIYVVACVKQLNLINVGLGLYHGLLLVATTIVSRSMINLAVILGKNILLS